MPLDHLNYTDQSTPRSHFTQHYSTIPTPPLLHHTTASEGLCTWVTWRESLRGLRSWRASDWTLSRIPFLASMLASTSHKLTSQLSCCKLISMILYVIMMKKNKVFISKSRLSQYENFFLSETPTNFCSIPMAYVQWHRRIATMESSHDLQLWASNHGLGPPLATAPSPVLCPPSLPLLTFYQTHSFFGVLVVCLVAL